MGSDEDKKEHTRGLVEVWCEQIQTLAKIAKSEPQTAYAGFVAGFKHKLCYHIRTIPALLEIIGNLDNVMSLTFLPAICDGHYCSTEERQLLSLPAQMGGLSIPIFKDMAVTEHENSRKITN